MAILPTRTSEDTVSSADINELSTQAIDVADLESTPTNSSTKVTQSAYLYSNIQAANKIQRVYSVSGNYIITDTDTYTHIYMSASGGSCTATLPTVADNTNRILTIIKSDSSTNTVTVDGEGAETINGRATLVIGAQYQGIEVISTGSAWVILRCIKPPERKYNIGTTYNSVSITFNGTPSVTSVTFGYLIPYQTIDGQWFIKGNVEFNVASASRTGGTVDLAGVTFTANYQPVTIESNIGASFTRCYVNNSNRFTYEHPSATTAFYIISFNVGITGKPTWAD